MPQAVVIRRLQNLRLSVAIVATLGLDGLVAAATAQVPLVPAARPAQAGQTEKGPAAAEIARKKPAAPPMTAPTVTFEPMPYAAVPGWGADDHAAAFAAFLKSCARLKIVATSTTAQRSAPSETKAAPPNPTLLCACDAALALAATTNGKITRETAKTFFEAQFIANRVRQDGSTGLLTGYYEPEIKGSRVPTAAFPVPLHRRPADLVNLVAESARAGVGDELTHARKTASGTAPFPTRAEIDQGAIAGQGLELVYLADAVEKFFLQVQGSGRVTFPDGTSTRISYDGKNGHPYSSIGRHLIDNGILAADRMSLAALGSWLRANPLLARDVMWQNKSYVFFRELSGAAAAGPLGVLDMPLTPGRSLAIDPRFHDLGMPIHVVAPTLPQPNGSTGLARLAIAQDVGSAIKGPERGDLYFGSGDAAGKLAGVARHPVSFFVLVPRPSAPASKP